MRPLNPFLALFALCFMLVNAADAFGCSDPEQHKIHMRQEMEARLRSQSAGGGAPQQVAAPVPSSALDSAEAFFKAPSTPPSQEQRARRR